MEAHQLKCVLIKVGYREKDCDRVITMLLGELNTIMYTHTDDPMYNVYLLLDTTSQATLNTVITYKFSTH